MEPYIEPSNAHNKVSVSPVQYFKFNNNIIKLDTLFKNSEGQYENIQFAWNIDKNEICLVLLNKLVELTPAEKILYVK